jgi:putative transposase
MRKRRFTEEQIFKVLKEHAVGLSAGELCRKYGISDATFYKWRSRYGGMEISDARKLKALETRTAGSRSSWLSRRLMRRHSRSCSEKTSDAQLAETCCDLGSRRERLFAAARLSPVRPAPEDLSLCDKEVWR